MPGLASAADRAAAALLREAHGFDVAGVQDAKPRACKAARRA